MAGIMRRRPAARTGRPLRLRIGEHVEERTLVATLRIFLGTSPDRIGSPAGTQSYYATVAKYLPLLHTSPYASVNHSEWDSRWNLPFGATVELGRGFSIRPMYDGGRTHVLGGWASERFSATVIWAWLERAGVAVSVGF
jgi:hypothetical protein